MTTQTIAPPNGNIHPAPVAPTFTEAPASVTLKISYRGYNDILFTLRDNSGVGLLDKLGPVIDRFEKMGITPSAPRGIHPASPTQSPGGGVICPEHGTPMKQGKKGYYCPMVVTEVQGRKIYCNHTA